VIAESQIWLRSSNNQELQNPKQQNGTTFRCRKERSNVLVTRELRNISDCELQKISAQKLVPYNLKMVPVTFPFGMRDGLLNKVKEWESLKYCELWCFENFEVK